MNSIKNDNAAKQITFNIKQVANRVGVSTATIRNWEKDELFVARRSESNYRVFTLEDIERLKRIKDYSINKHMGINAIKMLVTTAHSDPLISAVDGGKRDSYTKKTLGVKWKKKRKKEGYTLDKVASSVGISLSHLSKLENGNANASLETLHKLASFYGENPENFLGDTSTEEHYLPAKKGALINIGADSGVKMESLVELHDHVMYPILYTVKPLSGNHLPHAHTGEEFIYILCGKIEFHLNNIIYPLAEGDSFYFRSSELHAWNNPSPEEPAKMIWIHSAIER